MNRLAVINVVGLTEALIGEHTPRITEFFKNGASAHVAPTFPAVTCSAQSNYLTGKSPSQHGVVGNGWYNRELAEIHFWKQSNHVVQSPKIWDALKLATGNQELKVANCFWWYNMYSSVDYSITPRPIYRAAGGKIFDVYSWPYSIREEIKKDLGEFPFFGFGVPPPASKTPQGEPDSAHALDCQLCEMDRKQIFSCAESHLSPAFGLQFAASWPLHFYRRYQPCDHPGFKCH